MEKNNNNPNHNDNQHNNANISKNGLNIEDKRQYKQKDEFLKNHRKKFLEKKLNKKRSNFISNFFYKKKENLKK